MKKTILFLFTILALQLPQAFAQSSDTWSIKLNKQVVIRSPVETSEPTIFLSKKEVLQGKSMITINYTTQNPEKDWNRSFTFNRENEQTAKKVQMKKQSGSITFPAKDLKQAAMSNQPLFVYTMSLPNDPEMAAVVRVRRFLLCKIEWKN